tara:strand:+ start:1257 stop:1391 length:135 start_codon:yes stop_codon:yes gene_type:complete
MEKIDKTISPYIDVVDEEHNDPSMVVIKDIVNKINEIVDWINTQ